MPPRNDIQGNTYGRLLVVESTDQRRNSQIVWRCRCTCGAETLTTGYMLKSGKTKSCGCLRRDMGVALGKASRRHGEGSNGKETPEYRCWANLASRCTNPKHTLYRHYGSRGIKVCDRWRDSYESFLEDMGRRPTDKHSLDRIDNNGNYELKNCRWATRVEQNRNTSRNHHVTIEGVTKTLAEWFETLSISRTTYYRRISTGMSPACALADDFVEISEISHTTRGRPPKLITINGITQSLTSWLAFYGIANTAYYRRIRKGHSPAEALLLG